MKWRSLQSHLLSSLLMTFAMYMVLVEGEDAESKGTSAELKKVRRNQKSTLGGESLEIFVLSESTSRQEILAEEGENVYIDCPINKTRVQGCEWYKVSSHGGDTKRITQFFHRYQRITPCQLQIRSVTYEDAGKIVCKAITDTTLTFNFTNHLTVTGPDDPFGNILQKPSAENTKWLPEPYSEPEINKELLPKDRVHMAHKGETILLKCEANGNPKPTVSWRRGSRNYTELTKGYSYLKLTNLTKEDAGAYKCEAVNIFGKVVSEVFVEVKGALQGASEIIDVTPRNITLYEGNQGNITCIARFEGDPWFGWVKLIENKAEGINTFAYEGHDYSVLPRTEIRPLGQHLFATTLLLQNVTTANGGVYHCIVAGLQGYNHSETYVTVEKDPAKLHMAQIRRHKAVAILWIFSFVIFGTLVILCIVRIYGCRKAHPKKPDSQTSLAIDTSSTRKSELPKRSPETLSTDCTNPRLEVIAPLVNHGSCSLGTQDFGKQECGSSCRTYNSYDQEYSVAGSDAGDSFLMADLEAVRNGRSQAESSCDSELCSQLSGTSPSHYHHHFSRQSCKNSFHWNMERSPINHHDGSPHQYHPTHPHHPFIYQHQLTKSESHQTNGFHQFPTVNQCSCNLDKCNNQNSQVHLVYVV